MDFDLQWLLLALPLAFALGWLGARLDLRQWRREAQDSPKAYFKGLSLLLNEQQDKAIDAFIEAVQQDPGSSDLHFALGNLFRRRGEYERAVRVHQHLLARADLSADERDRAQHALAQDYLKAGLFDRAEQAYQALQGTAFATDARLALLTLHERSRDWKAAIEVARGLESVAAGSFAQRISHYWCELALEADAHQQPAEADAALAQAFEVAPQAVRPRLLAGQRLARQGRTAEALALWNPLIGLQSAAFSVVA
ncbi:MAG: tetratricopeptide repeat protein, partial [Burkholderiales bacterium]